MATSSFFFSDEPLSSNVDVRPADAEVGAVRANAALVRSLLQELDELAPPAGPERAAGAFAAHAIEELSRLAHRMIEVAASIAPHRVAELRVGIDGATP